MNENKFNILIVEDNRADAELTTEALHGRFPAARLHVVRDGEEALDFLYRRNAYNDATRPQLVFLDLNLPKKSGLEVLEAMKGDESLKSMPTVVFTSSEAPRDIQRCYDLHANCYVTKPLNLEQFMGKVKAASDFWCRTAALP
jgi:chemotaxis family two-component system response regulator Rcp1